MDEIMIKKTQETLGKVITKPPLTEKLLTKPPFRFLHDITTNVIKKTGYMKGLFTEKELVSDNVKDKENKIAFLQKVIDLAILITGKSPSVKPSKIVAGHEPEKTNELLQLIAEAASLHSADHNDLVKKVLNGEKIENVKPPIKSESVKADQDEKKDDSADKQKKESKHREKSSTREREASRDREKDRTKDRKSRERNKEDKEKESGERPKEEKETDKDKSSKNRDRSKDEREKDKHKSSREKEHRKDRENRESNKEHRTKDRDRSRDGREKERHRSSKDPEKDKRKDDKHSKEEEDDKADQQNDNNVENESAETQINGSEKKEDAPARIPRPTSAKGSRGRLKDARRNELESDKDGDKAGDDDMHNFEKESNQLNHKTDTEKSSVQPQTRMARPSSARPAPPRIKKTEQAPEEPHIVGNGSGPNLIIDKNNDSDDDDGAFISEDLTPLLNDVAHPSTQPIDESEDHGGLVKKILESKKEFEESDTSNQKKVEIERVPVNDAAKQKEREHVQKEINKLRTSIQLLTRSVNPLGKIMDFIQEDLDQMQKELSMWMQEHGVNINALKSEQHVTEDSLKPLKAQLVELESSVTHQLDSIAAVKANKLRNNEKIEKMLIMHKT